MLDSMVDWPPASLGNPKPGRETRTAASPRDEARKLPKEHGIIKQRGNLPAKTVPQRPRAFRSWMLRFGFLHPEKLPK
jgi:hypothetical protein